MTASGRLRRGEGEWELFMTELRDAASSVSSQVWLFVEVPHGLGMPNDFQGGYPLVLSRMQAPNASKAEQVKVGTRACTDPDCCKDDDFTIELLAGLKGIGLEKLKELMNSPEIGALLQTMGKLYKETNMSMEDFLAVVRSAVFRCCSMLVRSMPCEIACRIELRASAVDH